MSVIKSTYSHSQYSSFLLFFFAQMRDAVSVFQQRLELNLPVVSVFGLFELSRQTVLAVRLPLYAYRTFKLLD